MSCDICLGSGREHNCPVCSQPEEEPKTCTVCGNEIDPDAEFCNDCGTEEI